MTSIRPAVPADMGAVADLWHVGWHDGHAGHVPEGLTAARTLEAFHGRTPARVGDTTVAVSASGELLGFVMVVGDEIEQVFVGRAARGTDLAGRLLAEAESQVAAAGHATAWLAVVVGNSRARRFYEKHGWSDDGDLPYEVSAGGTTYVSPCRRYVKDVRASRAIGRVAVFCASSPGVDPALARQTYDVGRGLAERGIGLVYGGGGHGLMREVSQGALDAGGEVVGVIPRSMIEREWGRDDLTAMHVVDTMHERKARMADLADAFLCLPGGLGTLEEIVEVWSWRYIGFNDDPVGFLDLGGVWTPFLDSLRGLVDAGFVRREVLDDVVVATDLDEALAGLAARRGADLGDKLRG